MRKSLLLVGEPAPWFEARCTCNPKFDFDTVGGFPVVLTFFQSAGLPSSHQVLADFQQFAPMFDAMRVLFYGVSIDPEDESQQRVIERDPGMLYFWDFDQTVSAQYGALKRTKLLPTVTDGYRRFSVVLDQRLRVWEVIPFDDSTAASHANRAMPIESCSRC